MFVFWSFHSLLGGFLSFVKLKLWKKEKNYIFQGGGWLKKGGGGPFSVKTTV